MPLPLPIQRTASVARKEFLHIIRDPMTLFFTLFVPICEMFMLGYAIDTNVRDVRMVVLDQAHTQESQDLVDALVQSGTFRVSRMVHTEAELNEEIVAGRARVGIW